MPYTIEDLGTLSWHNTFNTACLATHPKTGKELGLVTVFADGGFIVVDLDDQSVQRIETPEPRRCTRNLVQAADGNIYQTTGHSLRVWKWEGDTMEEATPLAESMVFTLDACDNGYVYLPAYTINTMYRYNTATGELENMGDYNEFGTYIRNVSCAKDGMVYVTCTDYQSQYVVMMDPKTKEKSLVDDLRIKSGSAFLLQKDEKGNVLVAADRFGHAFYKQLIGGKAVPINQEDVQLVSRNCESPSVAFSDGRFIRSVEDGTVHVGLPDGTSDSFTFDIPKSPLKNFTVLSGGSKIWVGTILPLKLFSYDVHTGETEFFGSPMIGGEIYTMAWHRERLYMASYGHGILTRYDTTKPYKKTDTIFSNPAHLGHIKEGGSDQTHVHRPRGVAQKPDGTIYFAAVGDYGCTDSAIARIHPETEELTHWIEEFVRYDALCYIEKTDQLIVSDCVWDTPGIRFRILDAETGETVSATQHIDDEGAVTSWLYDGDDIVYGIHNHRATLFAYSVSQDKIVRSKAELGVGNLCYNMLVNGDDGRIWGLSDTCVFAVDHDLTTVEILAEYGPVNGFYRMGFTKGEDGHLYFANGNSLMRLKSQ